MNRNILKWILIAAVIVGAAGFLILGGTSSKKEEIAVGHSKAFKIEPVEGITISAPKNALDKDREFKVSPVSDEEWEKATKKVMEASLETTPLLCFDLDAGMKPDDIMPGYFQVTLDLDKLGIPKSLHDKLTVWRDGGGDDVYEYTSWVENGKLCFNSDQNCSIILGFAVGVPLLVTVMYGTQTFQKHLAALHLYKGFFFQRDDLVIHEIKDKYGDFTLYFRFGDTEESSRFQSYKENAERYYSEFNKVKKQADEIYQHKVDKEYKTELEDMDFWQKLVGSKAAYNRAKEAIDKTYILDSLSSANKYLQRYIKGMELPKSIQEVEHFLKISNEYYTLNQHLKPQTSKIDVFLVDSKSVNGEACLVYVAFKNPYMVVNFDLPWADDPQRQHYQRKGRFENLLLTINHELLHYRQKSTKSMDYRTEESMAAYNEKHAAYFFYNKHEVYANLFSKDPETKAYVEKYYQWAPRSYYQAFGAPFNDKTDNDWAYTYADFMDFLQRKTRGETDYVSNAFLINDYRKSSTPKENYMRWFDIKEEKLFNDYLKEFCFDSINRIFFEQMSEANTIPDRQQDLAFSKDKPIVEVKTGKGGLVTRTLFATSGRGNKGPIFNVFLLREKNVFADDLAFIGSWDNFARDANGAFIGTVQGDYFEGNTNTYKCGFFKVPNESLKITMVALFAPDAPEIRRVKDDQIRFVIPKAARALTKEELITGVEATITFDDGTKVTETWSRMKFGKSVDWPGLPDIEKKSFKMTLHWFYKENANTIYKSPESEPATWNNKPKDEKPKDKPVKVDEKKGYWKQVQASGNVQSKSIDESSIVNGLASRDLRGIELKKVNGENEVEFTGTACSKIKEDGKTLYQPETFLDGYISFTEPPKQWPANTNYTCEWYIAEDPFVKKMDNPFTFKVENTSSAPKACGQGKDKVTEKNSKTAKAKWLNQEKTVFKTNTPKKDDPRAFTIVQKFTISGGSNLDAVVFLSYDYEWVEGEMEEEEVKEEETPPEEGHWQLVKTETDDSHRHFQAEDIYGDKNKTTATINGGSGIYSMHVDWWGAITNGKQFTGKNGFIYKINRQFHGGTPKQYYTPGKNFNLSWVSEELQAESLVEEMPFNAKSFDHYPNGSLSLLGYDAYLLRKNNNRIACDAKRTPDRMEMNLGVVPAKEAYPKGFVICEVVVLDYPSAAAPGCFINNYYFYEWVEGEPEEETAPEGGHWRLVNVEDDSRLNGEDQGSTVTISGSGGHYSVHEEFMGAVLEWRKNNSGSGAYWETGEVVVKSVVDREISVDVPKNFYYGKEELLCINEAAEEKESETKASRIKGVDYPMAGFNIYQPDYQPPQTHRRYQPAASERQFRKNRSVGNLIIPEHDAYTLGEHWTDGFKIVFFLSTPIDDCYVRIIYTYEWVDGK